MDPTFEKAFLAQKQEPPFDGNFSALRERYNSVRIASNKAALIEYPSQVKVETRYIPVRDGAEILVRIYTPKSAQDAADTRALCIMLHGGGFCLGSLENEDVTCRRISDVLGVIAVNVDYRLAPEHKFPIGVHDAYDAVKWVALNSLSLKADLTKGFIIGGVSAGANFAAVICHALRDEVFPHPVTGCFLDIPTTIHPEAVPERFKSEYQSYARNKDAPILNQRQLDLFFDLYKGEPTSSWCSPLLHPIGHRGLPPTYFKACGLDPLLDDALIYERVLREESGVTTRLSLYGGVPHSFSSIFPELEVSRKWNLETIDGVAWLLNPTTTNA